MSSMQTYYWKSVLGMLVVWGVLAQKTNFVLADIIPDSTLPIQSSADTQNNITTISGGTQTGNNLLHSFQQFSVPSGSTAFFNNGSNIENIISRVTGNSISNIEGLIKANGAANLFLINPSGFIFGLNAKLEIGGSFVASTANGLKFANGTEFSTTSTTTAPLLTIGVPVGLQYGTNAGDIELQGSNLQVNSGKTLAVVGGNVTMDKGQLIAESGRIELGGLKQAGIVSLNTDTTGNIFSLNYPVGVQRGDLSVISTVARVASDGGGSISVNTRNLDISKVGVLVAGFKEGLGKVGAVAGDINVDVTDNTTLSGGSVIATVINSKATGDAGNINLKTGSFNLLSGSQLFGSTAGQGNGGNINVNVSSAAVFDSAGLASSTSGIINSVDITGVGKGGNVTLDAGSVTITNGAQLNLLTNGKGSAGNIIINSRSGVSVDGSNVGASGILTSVGENGIGKGGDISIATGSLSVTNGAQLNALSKNQGSAGNVSINARNGILLDGENQKNAAASAIFTTIDETGVGSGGEINISTDSLTITKGAGLYTLTNGKGDSGDISVEASGNILMDGVNSQGGVSGLYTSVTPKAVGNAGEIKISTGSLTITSGAALNTLTKGQGSAGNVFINARDTISFDGININGGASGIYTTVDEKAVGNGGSIDIQTGSLSITGGSGLFTLTKSQGNGGNVNINARNTVSFDGINKNSGSSGIFSSVDRAENSFGVGKGGDINITANSLSLARGAGLYAITKAQGDAGNINIDARKQVSLDGVNSLTGGASGIYSTVEPQGIGNGKKIQIKTGQFFVTNGAIVSSTSAGNGAAGNIIIDADSIRLNRGILSSDTVKEEGNINLRSTDLVLRNRSQISTNATGKNVIGGNININAGVLAGFENSNITANSIDFRGGNVKINTQGIFGIKFRDVALPSTSNITATGANNNSLNSLKSELCVSVVKIDTIKIYDIN
jgi:filamentous hemagglutinin family protein